MVVVVSRRTIRTVVLLLLLLLLSTSWTVVATNEDENNNHRKTKATTTTSTHQRESPFHRDGTIDGFVDAPFPHPTAVDADRIDKYRATEGAGTGALDSHFATTGELLPCPRDNSIRKPVHPPLVVAYAGRIETR